MYSTLSGIHCAPHGPVHVHVHLRKTVGASAFAQRLNRAGFSTKVSTSVENDAVMQETSDYMKAIDECRHFGADATVVIQDDVWATPSFYSDLITSVRAAGAKGKDAWMLKAFTTMRWEGWSLHEPRHWVELILVGLIGCASYAAMLRRGEYLHSSGTKRLFAQIASAAIFVVSVAIIGRQNFLFDIRARPGIVSNEMGASAVCIAFSARAVELAQRLSNASHTTLYDDRDPIDVILSKWRQAAGIPQYITNPSLVVSMQACTRASLGRAGGSDWTASTVDSRATLLRADRPAVVYLGLFQEISARSLSMETGKLKIYGSCFPPAFFAAPLCCPAHNALITP